MIRWLDTLSVADTARVGAKAARLGELARAGLPVPAGFVVEASAYEAFTAAYPPLTAALAGQSPPAALATVLTPLFAGLPLPAGLEAAVRDAYRRLAGGAGTEAPAVAVRSSALDEDGSQASFAGMAATYLNATGEDQVLSCLRACWASLWSERALVYRRARGCEQGVGMAVLVQVLVVPSVAGVAFTADPLTGARDVILIDASFGLGEAVVSGRATPDHITMTKATGAVRRYMIGAKEVEVLPAPEGVAEAPVARGRRRQRALSEPALAALHGLCAKVEHHFDFPQDLEFAWTGEQMFLLQARPITALPPAPPLEGWGGPTPGAHWERRNVAEHFPGPVGELTATLVLPAMGTALGAVARSIGFAMPQPALQTLHGYVYARGDMRLCWDLPWRAARVYGGLILGGPRKWQRAAGGPYAARLASLPVVDAGDPRALIGWLEAYVAAFAATWEDVHRLSAGWRWSEYFLGLLLGPAGDRTPALLSGYLSPTFALMGQAHALAAGATPAVAAALASPAPWAALVALGDQATKIRARIEALSRLGAHMPATFDPAVPLPYAGPEEITGLVAAAVGAASPAERQDLLVRGREQATAEVFGLVHGPRRALLLRMLPWAQAFAAHREPALATLGLEWDTFRARLLQLGAHLQGLGVLDAPEGIFDMAWSEVVAVVRGEAGPTPAVLAARRALHDERCGFTPPLQVGGVPERGLGRAIAGTPTSPGRVSGVARVVRGPEDFASLLPGEVLVAPATTPAWTPLFARAAAIVTDVGGPLSHGSIVAREFGIPAVLGTGSATRRLRSGDRVTVDGDSGLVWLGEGP